MSIKQDLSRLETQARKLEPTQQQRAVTTQAVLAYAHNFIDKIETAPAFLPTDHSRDPFPELPVSESPRPINEVLQFVEKHVDGVGLNPASGGHLGYIPGGGIYNAAMGDLLADVTNRYAGVYVPGPGAVRLENYLIRWMAELVGYPTTAHGNLASGGSIANLMAIVAARDNANLQPEQYKNAVVYLSEQRHHCVDKALRIAGLASCHVRFVPLDERFRMKPEALRAMMEADRQAGLLPWLVVANAGSTDTGAVDPLQAIGRLANQHKVWFHIDAAYGGFFLLTEHGRSLMQGTELSDSIAMDPHKGLFLPYGLGALIVKRAETLANPHHYQANYIQNDTTTLSPADLSPELTKHFRGMRLWLPLQLHGLAPFRAALEEKLLLARYFRQQLMQLPGWHVGPEPDLSVVIYRFQPATGDANTANTNIAQRVIDDGRVFISYTTINGTVWLRLAVLAFRTHKSTIDCLLEQLKVEVDG